MDAELNFTPRGDLVFASVTDDHLRFGALVVAGEEGHDQARRGIVEYVGPDVADVSVGDRIVFGKWFGEAVQWQGKRMLVMHESDVIGVEE